MAHRVTIILNNLNFCLRVNDTKLMPLIEYITNRMVTYTFTFNKYLKRMVRIIDNSYYNFDTKKNIYRFPIKVIKHAMAAIGQYGVKREDIEIINNCNIDIDSEVYEWNKKFILRDYQEDYVNAILNNLDKKIFLIDASTGVGKTLCSCYLMHSLKMRSCIILLPKFINKWVDDLKEKLLLTDDDIYIVQGSESLIDLMLEEDIDYKIIIFSITTLTYYLSDYETDKYDYPVSPDKLMEHLKIGIIFNDESHLCFAALTHCLNYFNAQYFIGATATFDSNQKDIKRMYNLVIPPENRISNLVQVEPYTYTKAVQYRVEWNKLIRYKRKQGYNHILYEQSIMKNNIFMENYFLMVEHYFREMYLNKRKDLEKDKIAIFFASIDMCTTFTNWLKNRYPTENIYRYVGGDSYHTMLESNIIISNNGMLGTAVDIPNLIAVIQTISCSSLQINVQNFGRLRNLKGREVWYCYLFSKEIPRQFPMHMDRYNVIKDKIKEYYLEVYPHLIKTI